MKIWVSVLFVLVLLAFGGTVLAAGESKSAPDSDDAKIVRSNNEFTLALYAKLRAGEGNLFFSPFSVSTALAMTYAGARGETASQMADALRFSLEEKRLHSAYGSLVSSLNARGEAGGYQLSVANALWGQKGTEFLPEFLDLVRSSYGAGLKDVDFVSDPEAARRTINDWIEEKTMEKIQELLARGTINQLTRLVLTNAIYFKGDWESEFDEARTEDAPFYLESGDSIDIPLMHQTEDFGYMETEDFQAISLPYVNEDLSMIVLLPRKIGGLERLEASISCEKLAGWMSKLQAQKVRVYLPKFKLTSAFTLNGALKSLGMTHAFSPDLADFSGMTGRRDLFIWAVVHKAFVDVNEEGTEAAAATGVVMGITSVDRTPKPIPVFRANHPFLFMIQDNQTESILFIGRLMKPEA